MVSIGITLATSYQGQGFEPSHCGSARKRDKIQKDPGLLPSLGASLTIVILKTLELSFTIVEFYNNGHRLKFDLIVKLFF